MKHYQVIRLFKAYGNEFDMRTSQKKRKVNMVIAYGDAVKCYDTTFFMIPEVIYYVKLENAYQNSVFCLNRTILFSIV